MLKLKLHSRTLHPAPLGLQPSFGFGDRLGLATSGHLDALRQHGGDAASGGGGIRPIFAQQSIREMSRTHRTPEQVMNAAADALEAEGYHEPWGADADHLKTPQDVEDTADAGFVFFTIDPSGHVDPTADSDARNVLDDKFDAVRAGVPWISDYLGKTIQVPQGPAIHFDELTVRRAAVKYGRAIAHSLELAAHIAAVIARRGAKDPAAGEYEIELSVDETPQPTTLAEHYIIADQCRLARPRGMKLVSLAPRYVGDFEKGIDYKGSLAELERSLADHAAIARALGPYKLSLHSGSDKLSIYALFAKATRGMFHVKTAGTSYLEALRVAARHDAPLFRRIIDFSRGRFDTDKATYHVSATLDAVPPQPRISDDRALERLYLDENAGRQILHVTFGSVLTDALFKPELLHVLKTNPATHRQILAAHFGKHLAALRRGM